MSDDDLWRHQEHAAEPSTPDTPAEGDQPAESLGDQTQPLTGGVPPAPPPAPGPSYEPPTGPGAVPPPYNPYAGGYGQPAQPGWGAQPGQPGGPGYLPPPNPYGPPQEYAQPHSPYGSPYQPAYAGGMLPDHPSATTAMVLGIISLVGVFVCAGLTLILAPAAWVVGAKAVREIDAAPGRYAGRDRAQSGKIMGIIGTVLLVLGVLAIILFVVAVTVSGSNSGPNPGPTFHQGGA